MPSVYNWQLGRPMQYPYEQAAPKEQFAFVININRCIGCQTCTMACKSTWTFAKGQEHMWWTNVETKPYGGYPHHWDVRILDLLEQANPGAQRWTGKPGDDPHRPYGQFSGKTVFEAPQRVAQGSQPNLVLGYLPTDEEWNAPNRFEDHPPTGPSKPMDFGAGADLSGDKKHETWFYYLARLCNHCSYPACLAACPRNAIYKRPEDGIVLIDQQECRGYRKCVEACPYKKSMYRGTTRTSEKCIACYPRVEGNDPECGGAPMETRCMAACIGQVRMQGLVKVNPDATWIEDRHNPLYFLVHVAKVALPLYPQFGTEPNGYYIPPRWVPTKFLEQMFGPGVQTAVERYRNPDRELLAVLQLFRRSNQIIARYEIQEGRKVYQTSVNGRKFEMYDDTIIAYNRLGKEMFRTKVEEPVHVRPAAHANSI
ncbi:MAG: nitrate oxidoreductase subunit beta [Phycisphaerae bacterium]|nr:MAG: nitrate oxidoreductase subunit beta [Planctomycetota bacterium]KAB2948691.1 MAG: nitrate oxidoreductase subunit beta [Phycisphaerae bacterium]MBE7455562.1 nitrate oxidoreductase subunit beta [Planctomycetia bacterium]MCK6466170.1 nitrate oxidoreductase subunit beta [Phycisphaerae bacterium]MCL4719925.1 nitrate oxidoreductase subunit beta [Phycisphaerae bacterium]